MASRTRAGWASATARARSSSSTTNTPTAAAFRCASAGDRMSDGRAHRRARQPLRQPVQPERAVARADAARGAVAAVRARQVEVRRHDPRRLHQDDGHLPARVGGAAHRRPLRAGGVGQLEPAAQAARAGARPGGAAATRRCCSNLEAEPQLGIRRSLKPIALPREALDYLSPRPRTAYFFETGTRARSGAAG